MSKWMKGLGKRQIKHLAEGSPTGRPTLRGLKENLVWQRSFGLRCFQCEEIARKVGLEQGR